MLIPLTLWILKRNPLTPIRSVSESFTERLGRTRRYSHRAQYTCKYKPSPLIRFVSREKESRSNLPEPLARPIIPPLRFVLRIGRGRKSVRRERERDGNPRYNSTSCIVIQFRSAEGRFYATVAAAAAAAASCAIGTKRRDGARAHSTLGARATASARVLPSISGFL